MVHKHQHDNRSLFVDQLCLIAIGAAFGVICVSLFLWFRPMLFLMLAPHFHGFVLVAGCLLLALSAMRLLLLRSSASKAEHLPCPHEHHGHDCCEEVHEWAPWRYVVLLVPITLFLLGIPNKGPAVGAATVHAGLVDDALAYSSVVAAGPEYPRQVVLAGVLGLDTASEAGTVISYKQFMQLAYAPPAVRRDWRGAFVSVKGQFAPSKRSDRVFGLVAFQIQCCGADLIRHELPMVCKDTVAHLRPGQWIEVSGTIDFHPHGGRFISMLRVPQRKAVTPSVPDQNPWFE